MHARKSDVTEMALNVICMRNLLVSTLRDENAENALCRLLLSREQHMLKILLN